MTRRACTDKQHESLQRICTHSETQPRAPQDWIVLNLTLHALAQFARDDPELRRELVPILRRHQADTRKSVAKRATELLAQLQQTL